MVPLSTKIFWPVMEKESSRRRNLTVSATELTDTGHFNDVR